MTAKLDKWEGTGEELYVLNRHGMVNRIRGMGGTKGSIDTV